MFNKILLAADGSENSVRASKQAVDLAKLNPEAHIVVVYVIDSKTSKHEVINNLNTEALTLQRKAKIEATLEVAKEAGVPYEIQFLRGEEPGPTIVEFVNKNNFDVVVIGSRGLNALQEFMLGSVSHKVAKRANCPVLIVK
jgi:nucleotide-binding universal stress UspA family protein